MSLYSVVLVSDQPEAQEFADALDRRLRRSQRFEPGLYVRGRLLCQRGDELHHQLDITGSEIDQPGDVLGVNLDRPAVDRGDQSRTSSESG